MIPELKVGVAGLTNYAHIDGAVLTYDAITKISQVLDKVIPKYQKKKRSSNNR